MSSQNINKWTIQDLINNLKKYKDGVVVVGDKAINELDLYVIDEKSKKILNKKDMVKKPKNFWDKYNELILKPVGVSKSESAINELIKTGCIKKVIDLNYTNNIKTILGTNTSVTKLKGNKDELRCMSCDKKYNTSIIEESVKNVLKCECGGKISPTIVMYGDKYLKANTDAIKDSIFKEEIDSNIDDIELNTHCLIFIGVDFEEDYMHELIESYIAIKEKVSTDNEPYFLIIITEKDGASIEYYQPEFATYENISESIERLTTLLNK